MKKLKKYLHNAKVAGKVAVRVLVLTIPGLIVLAGDACASFMWWADDYLPAGLEEWQK